MTPHKREAFRAWRLFADYETGGEAYFMTGDGLGADGNGLEDGVVLDAEGDELCRCSSPLAARGLVALLNWLADEENLETAGLS